jgi:hypothetical protein
VRTDPFSRETAYVTVSGFRWGEPLPHVYRTTDLGASWAAIAGNLPEAPANDFLADPAFPGHYFVATDVGVYRSFDAGATWSMLGSNLPRVVVTSLAFNATDRLLYAATYGRSFFTYEVEDLTSIAALPAASPPDVGRLLPASPNPTRGETRISWETDGPAEVRIDVFSVAGRRVFSRRVGASAAGAGELLWNGCDSRGRTLPAGAYFVRAFAGGRHLGDETVVLVR